MMFAKTSLLYSIIRCELCLCCSVWCLEFDRYGLARVHNKLIMHILPAERKFMRLSSAEVVRNRFRARINEILIRWPMAVTAQPNISRHNQISHSTTKNSHGTTKHLTAQPNISRHNQTSHGTTKYLTAQPKTLTAQPNISRHNQISHGTTKYLTAQPNISRHNQISHGTTENSHGTTKYFTAQPNISRHNQATAKSNK